MTRVLRWTVLAAVSIGAALAIISLLGGDFGEVQGKVIATSFIIAGGGLLVLACMSAWEDDRLGFVPWIGSAASIAGCVLLITGMWSELDNDDAWRLTASLLIIGAAVALASLLAMARLEPRYRWLSATGYGVVALVAASGIGLLWWDDPPDAAIRLFGVMAVLLATVVVSVPVLHFAGRGATAGYDRQLPVSHCPVCGTDLEATAGEPISCAECHTRFRVEVLALPAP